MHEYSKYILFEIDNICSFNLEIPYTVYSPQEDTFLLAEAIINLNMVKGRSLEIGSGSGAVSLLLAHLGWNVLSCDINPYAVAATRANAKRYGFSETIKTIENGVGEDLVIDPNISLIVWNLPYLNPLKDGDEQLEYIEDAAYIDTNNGGWSEKLLKELEHSQISDDCVVLLLFRTYPKSPSSPVTWKNRGWASRLVNRKVIADEKLEVYAFWKPGNNKSPLIIEKCDSTMDEAKKLSGIGWNRILTNNQNKGRGRRSSKWVSGTGDMLATWVIPKSSVQDISIGLLQIEIGSLVADALNVNLKWPNDIVSIDFRKMGGIIIESSDAEDVIRVGIGLNKNIKLIDGQRTSGWSEIFEDANHLKIFENIDAALSSRFEFPNLQMLEFNPNSLINSWNSLSRYLSRGVILNNNQIKYRVVGLKENGFLEILNSHKMCLNDSLDNINWEYDINN